VVSQRRTVRTLAATAVLLGAALSACTDDAAAPKPLSSPSSSADPSPSGSGSTSVGPTASATPSPPAMPREARGTSDKAAEAFARHYVALINYAMRSGDTSVIKRWAMSSCSTCLALAHSIDDLYRSKGHTKGGGWKILGSERSTRKSGDRTYVQFQIRITEQTIYETPGAKPSTSGSGKGRLEFELRSSSDLWEVRRLGAYA
jgi:hypothetical protein